MLYSILYIKNYYIIYIFNTMFTCSLEWRENQNENQGRYVTLNDQCLFSPSRNLSLENTQKF